MCQRWPTEQLASRVSRAGGTSWRHGEEGAGVAPPRVGAAEGAGPMPVHCVPVVRLLPLRLLLPFSLSASLPLSASLSLPLCLALSLSLCLSRRARS